MEMHELLSKWREWSECGVGAVLATVTEVEGHAYRKSGASMLLLENGERFGSISPGCLETDLAERVESLLAHPGEQWVEYDMRPTDDLSWGEMIGCGGRIRVLLEPLTGVAAQAMTELKLRLDRGETVCLIRNFADSWSVAGYGLHEATESARRDGEVTIATDRTGCRMTISYAPKPRLLLFGATDDAMPLAALAACNGFRVLVGDWREGLLTEARFPAAERFVGSPEAWVRHVNVQAADYAVVMSHHFPKDQELLQQLTGRKLRYLGIMGSVSRTGRLLDGQKAPAWFRFPVGLQIGAMGPDEIAVSIMAELIAVRRQGGGAHERTAATPEATRGRHRAGGGDEPANGPAQAEHRFGSWRKARRLGR